MKNYLKLFILSIALVLISCDPSTDSPTPLACTVIAPLDYTFEIDESSTVSFSGQTARLSMVEEILSMLASSNSTDVSLLNQMYADGTGFTDVSLDSSGKQLRSKTASYQISTIKVYVQSQFDDMLVDFANNVAPAMASNTMAAPGIAGMVGNRELNAKGMEIDQCFAKGLIGALCLDQIANGYLSEAKIGDGVDNTTRDDNYNNSTAMEHHWDEGFGYVYGLEPDILMPNYNAVAGDGTSKAGSLMNKYLGKFDDYRVSVYNSFTEGRQAIVENCSDVRDTEAANIKVTLSNVVMSKAESYLREAAESVDQSDVYFHALSEGYGFILSLQFTCDNNGMPYFSHSEVNQMLSQLEEGNGFWDRTDTEIIQMADNIKAVSGL